MVHTKTASRREHAARLASSQQAISGRGAILQRRQDAFARKWLDSLLRIADQLGITTILVSITHPDSFAAATAIGIGE